MGLALYASSVRGVDQHEVMDGFDWFHVFTRLSPRRVVSIVVLSYVALLCFRFGPAWDLFDWAVQQRVQQITDSVLTP